MTVCILIYTILTILHDHLYSLLSHIYPVLHDCFILFYHILADFSFIYLQSSMIDCILLYPLRTVLRDNLYTPLSHITSHPSLQFEYSSIVFSNLQWQLISSSSTYYETPTTVCIIFYHILTVLHDILFTHQACFKITS